VLNAAELLARDYAPEPESAEGIDIIVRQARQMARLLDDLLDVSRVTQGKIEIRKQVVDLTRLVKDTVDAVRPSFDARRQSLTLAVDEEPLCVEGDPSRLLQIQENLLGNASKYSPIGGRILLSLHREGDEAVITVADNGQGIPPEMLSAIFDLFVQGPKSLARTEGGMGIGLSLVRTLVELHGGTVTVHSDGRDRGSTFTVRLPITKKRPTGVDGCLPKKNLKGTKVLIVEDNDDSRVTLTQLLRLYGCDVVAVADGISGFEAIRAEKPEVALLDIGLPGMDGYSLARRVREELKRQPVRLIALTGYGRAEDRAAVLNAGFDAHIVKPVNHGELLRLLGGSD
jgi:two-component system CheB/CheR fusion protein